MRLSGVGEDSWTARRPNQSILKEISLEYSLVGLMLKLKFQYSSHLMQRTDSWKRPWYWERLKAGGEGDNRGWDGWMASPIQWTSTWANSGRWWGTGKPSMLQSMKSQTWLGNWTMTKICQNMKHSTFAFGNFLDFFFPEYFQSTFG